MLGGKNTAINLFIIFTFTLSVILEVATLPIDGGTNDQNINKKKPASYRRYVRKLPPIFQDDEYMEEVVEEFFVRFRPPQYAMSDDDIDLIIACDFNPEHKDCFKLKDKNLPPTANGKPTTVKPTTPPPPPPEDIPLLPDIQSEEEDDFTTTTEPQWSEEVPKTTEAEPEFYETDKADEDDQDEDKADDEEYEEYVGVY